MNETCVCCNEIIPEGTMVCWTCEHSMDDVKQKVENETKNNGIWKNLRKLFGF